VRRHLKHDRWKGRDGEFVASRLVLPAEDHFHPVAAFIAEELIRNGLRESLQRAFTISEPIIEMALRRAALSEEMVVGLIGELRFLNTLLGQAGSPAARGLVLETWGGYRRDARDFAAGDLAVEVKTTRGSRSDHRVSGVRQVDPLRNATDDPVEQLYLLSIGLTPASQDEDPSATVSLPASVDDALRFLGPSSNPDRRTEAQQMLLSRIAEYGNGPLGYDHDVMRSWPAYSITFRQGFIRVYDMNDEGVHVLRMRQLDSCDAVPSASVSFDISLPERIRGDINPELDIVAFARRVLGQIAG
jgi:hypothetical protein